MGKIKGKLMEDIMRETAFGTSNQTTGLPTTAVELPASDAERRVTLESDKSTIAKFLNQDVFKDSKFLSDEESKSGIDISEELINDDDGISRRYYIARSINDKTQIINKAPVNEVDAVAVGNMPKTDDEKFRYNIQVGYEHIKKQDLFSRIAKDLNGDYVKKNIGKSFIENAWDNSITSSLSNFIGKAGGNINQVHRSGFMSSENTWVNSIDIKGNDIYFGKAKLTLSPVERQVFDRWFENKVGYQPTKVKVGHIDDGGFLDLFASTATTFALDAPLFKVAGGVSGKIINTLVPEVARATSMTGRAVNSIAQSVATMELANVPKMVQHTVESGTDALLDDIRHNAQFGVMAGVFGVAGHAVGKGVSKVLQQPRALQFNEAVQFLRNNPQIVSSLSEGVGSGVLGYVTTDGSREEKLATAMAFATMHFTSPTAWKKFMNGKAKDIMIKDSDISKVLEYAKQHDVSVEVAITKLGAQAPSYYLREGDQLHQINGQSFATLGEAIKAGYEPIPIGKDNINQYKYMAEVAPMAVVTLSDAVRTGRLAKVKEGVYNKTFSKLENPHPEKSEEYVEFETAKHQASISLATELLSRKIVRAFSLNKLPENLKLTDAMSKLAKESSTSLEFVTNKVIEKLPEFLKNPEMFSEINEEYAGIVKQANELIIKAESERAYSEARGGGISIDNQKVIDADVAKAIQVEAMSGGLNTLAELRRKVGQEYKVAIKEHIEKIDNEYIQSVNTEHMKAVNKLDKIVMPEMLKGIGEKLKAAQVTTVEEANEVLAKGLDEIVKHTREKLTTARKVQEAAKVNREVKPEVKEPEVVKEKVESEVGPKAEAKVEVKDEPLTRETLDKKITEYEEVFNNPDTMTNIEKHEGKLQELLDTFTKYSKENPDSEMRHKVNNVRAGLQMALDLAAMKSKKNINDAGKQLNSFADVGLVKDYAIVAADLMYKAYKAGVSKANEFRDYVRNMIAEFGASIRPLLIDIYNEAKKIFTGERALFNPNVLASLGAFELNARSNRENSRTIDENDRKPYSNEQTPISHTKPLPKNKPSAQTILEPIRAGKNEVVPVDTEKPKSDGINDTPTKTKKQKRGTESKYTQLEDIASAKEYAEKFKSVEEYKKLDRAGKAAQKDDMSELTKETLESIARSINEGGMTKNSAKQLVKALVERDRMQHKAHRDINKSGVLSRYLTPAHRRLEDNLLVRGMQKVLFDRSELQQKEYKEFEDTLNPLIREARKSRSRTIKEHIVAKDTEVVDYLEGKSDGSNLTTQEMKLATFLKGWLKEAVPVMTKGGRVYEDYFTHMKQTYLEQLNAEGFVGVAKGLFEEKNKEWESKIMTVLNAQIALQKFNPFELARVHPENPYSLDIARVISTYSKIYYLKKNFDSLRPIMTSLTSVMRAKKGLEEGAIFLNNYFKQVTHETSDKTPFFIKQGVHQAMRLNALRFLGLNMNAGVINTFAGQVDNVINKGLPHMAEGMRRAASDKGQAILNKMNVSDTESVGSARGVRHGISKLSGMILYGHMSGMGKMPFGERWIQGSLYLAGLTKAEFESGNISARKHRQLLEESANIHGAYRVNLMPYGKTQTLGKAALQFRGWSLAKITNRFDRVKNIIVDAKEGNLKFDSPDVQAAIREALALGTLAFLLTRTSEDEGGTDEILANSLGDTFNVFTTDWLRWNMKYPVPAIRTVEDLLNISELALFGKGQKDNQSRTNALLQKGLDLMPGRKFTKPLLEDELKSAREDLADAKKSGTRDELIRAERKVDMLKHKEEVSNQQNK